MKILQIIPANGWYAKYHDRNPSYSYIYYEPVVCWALMEINLESQSDVIPLIQVEDELDDATSVNHYSECVYCPLVPPEDEEIELEIEPKPNKKK